MTSAAKRVWKTEKKRVIFKIHFFQLTPLKIQRVTTKMHTKLFLKTRKITVCFLSIIISKTTIAQSNLIDTNLAPPNGIRISKNLYCDKTEIQNIHWHEYMYWTKQVFGENSTEYLSTLPNYNVWNDVNINSNNYEKTYFTHPAYKYYPIIGITQLQAIRYSKWRSDRYFEHLLIQNNIISKDSQRNRENYFTMEKFFNGQLKNIINNTIKIEYVPYFHLPNKEERTLILAFSDSIESRSKELCKKKKCLENLKINPIVYCNVDLNPLNEYPVRASLTQDRFSIPNIRGNVAEWGREENISYGGAWNSDCLEIFQKDSVTTINQNAFTGFRNVFYWRKWVP